MRRPMKKRIVGIVGLTALLAGGAWAVAGRWETADRPLQVSPEVANLGRVRRLGGVVTTSVEIRNPGTRDLTVKRITTS